MSIGWIAVVIGSSIIGAVIGALMPLVGSLLIGSLSMLMLMSLDFVVLWIVVMVKTYSGGKMVLPFIGPLAEKQAG